MQSLTFLTLAAGGKMQVNLDVIDWKALKEAGSIDEFLETASEDVQISGVDIGWDSDSASLYFQVGMSVEAVLDVLPSDQADAVRTGLLPLIYLSFGDRSHALSSCQKTFNLHISPPSTIPTSNPPATRVHFVLGKDRLLLLFLIT